MASKNCVSEDHIVTDGVNIISLLTVLDTLLFLLALIIFLCLTDKLTERWQLLSSVPILPHHRKYFKIHSWRLIFQIFLSYIKDLWDLQRASNNAALQWNCHTKIPLTDCFSSSSEHSEHKVRNKKGLKYLGCVRFLVAYWHLFLVGKNTSIFKLINQVCLYLFRHPYWSHYHVHYLF